MKCFLIRKFQNTKHCMLIWTKKKSENLKLSSKIIFITVKYLMLCACPYSSLFIIGYTPMTTAHLKIPYLFGLLEKSV